MAGGGEVKIWFIMNNKLYKVKELWNVNELFYEEYKEHINGDVEPRLNILKTLSRSNVGVHL